MAGEEILPGFDTTQVASTASTIGVTLMYVFLFVLLLGIVALLWYLSTFNKRVLILERRKNSIIFNGFDKARQYKTREGIIKWKLLRNKIVMNRPPGNSLYHNHKGKEVGVAFLDNETIAWPEIDIVFNDEQLEKIKFVPFTSEDRTALAHEFRESDAYRKKRVLDLVSQLAPLGALIIIIALLLLFAGDFYKSVGEPATALANKLDGTVDKINTAIDKMDVLVNNRQLQQQGGEDIVRPSTPPN